MDVVERENLVDNTRIIGQELKDYLLSMQEKGIVSRVRGKGTFLAFDPNQDRLKVLKDL